MTVELDQIVDGKYRIVRLLGRGGMGAVYEAEHVALGRRVALKVLAPALAGDEGAMRRLFREARAAAGVGHENICEVIDVGRSATAPAASTTRPATRRSGWRKGRAATRRMVGARRA